MAFQLGILTDEISEDLERALDRAREWGLGSVDLRTLWGKNVVDLSAEEVGRARALLERRGMLVGCIASPVFKSPLRAGDPGPDGFQYYATPSDPETQLAVLERALATASALGAPLVRVFSFWRRPRSPEVWAEIAGYLRRAARLAEQAGRTVVVENEFVCNAATGAEAAALDDLVGAPRCRLLWDPGNAYLAGERPYPDGYRSVRGRIAALHAKDGVRHPAPGEHPWRVLGEGEVDWRGQLAALVADRFDGPLTIEPHPTSAYSKEEMARRSLLAVRRLLAEVGAEVRAG